jgi:uncharacterized protein
MFGSVARGMATDDSDIDLLVEIERGRTLLDLVGFEQALEDEFGISIDVVVERSVHPVVKPNILAEARALQGGTPGSSRTS